MQTQLTSSINQYPKFDKSQGRTRELSKIYFDKIPVLQVPDKTNKEFEN